MNLKPKICNLCGGEVILKNLKEVDRKTKLKNRKCYYCLSCKNYVLTDRYVNDLALGTIADRRTRKKRQQLHSLMNNLCKYHKQRSELYLFLADELGIRVENCHFGYMDYEMLCKAEKILLRLWKIRYDI